MGRPKGYKPLEHHQSDEDYARQVGHLKDVSREFITPAMIDAADIITFATEYLGVSFKKRPAQELVLRLIYGLPLPTGTVEVYIERPAEGLVLEPVKITWEELYRLITTNQALFESDVEKNDTQLVIGRRGGKSMMTAIVTLYEATRKKYRKCLNPGEYGYAIITATRKKQAEDILLATCIRLLQNSKIKYYIDGDPTASELRLRNGMRIAAYPCNSKAALGLPIFFLAFDELAHFMIEGVKADRAVVDALRPGMQQFASAKPKMFAISTPAAKQGYFWDVYKQGFQVSGQLLVQAPSWVFNPPSAMHDPECKFLRREHRRDPDSFDREYRGNFAEQMAAFFAADKVDEACVLPARVPYDPRYFYFCGIDQSGLSGGDRFSMAVSHRDPANELVTVDFVESWDTEDADWIITKVRELAQSYRLTTAVIDRYATGWVRSALRRVPLEVELRPSLAEVYTNLKTLLLAHRLELPDTQSLRKALVETQAFYSKANNLSIAHERHSEGHGDEADAVATAVMAACQATWLPSRPTVEEEMLAAAGAVTEANYNPLTWELN